MTIETDSAREEILALLKASDVPIPDYSADPLVLRRVGRTIAQAKARVFDSPFGVYWPPA